MKRGTQIIFIPDYAHDNRAYDGCEDGFVTKLNPSRNTAFCRYWSRHYGRHQLRTLANGEETPLSNLVEKNTRDQDVVEALLQFCP